LDDRDLQDFEKKMIGHRYEDLISGGRLSNNIQ